MGQHHVEAWPELLPGPPDRALVVEAQDEVTACVINGLKCLGIIGRIMLHSMPRSSDVRRVARPCQETGNALGNPGQVPGFSFVG